MDRGAWRATAHRVTKSLTQLKRPSMHTHTHSYGGGGWGRKEKYDIIELLLNFMIRNVSSDSRPSTY